jgi:polyribonucleotide nucleotidyltransferase
VVNALVLSVSKKILNLTLKPLLLASAKGESGRDVEAISIPDKVADLLPGQVVAGFIFKVETYGVIVKFREALTALVPRPNVADRFVSNPEGLFVVGDSVRCVIQRVDLARERYIYIYTCIFIRIYI